MSEGRARRGVSRAMMSPGVRDTAVVACASGPGSPDDKASYTWRAAEGSAILRKYMLLRHAVVCQRSAELLYELRSTCTPHVFFRSFVCVSC